MKIFWAWQSDLPGKVCRFFVRDALLAAIEKIKEVPDIEEPSEEARRHDIHLDSDRHGLSGSPDLARAILQKIDASSVFVGDVTPVGEGRPIKADDGTSRAKPLTNPNVAIELGYALARHGDARILMVLNTAYGSRDGLPFDIKHKAGPIMYRLAESASNKDIAEEKARLVPKLVEALRAFKPIEASTVLSSLPDLRVADNPRVIDLFEGDQRDKLFPLLEAEKLTAWARPMKSGELPLTRLPGNIWKSHFLLSLPKERQWDRAQSFIKTQARQETIWYDLHLNQQQVERVWPDLEWVPILMAARLAFEAAEELGIEDLVSSSNQDAEQKLSYFVNSFLVRDYPLKGKKPPSNNSRFIPKEELNHLHHVVGTASIRSDFASTPLRYDDVMIIRTDLNEYIGSLRSAARTPI